MRLLRPISGALCLILLLPAITAAQTPGEVDLVTTRLSDRVAVIHTAGGEATMVVAIASEAGVVVVDTERSLLFTGAIRQTIEEIFPGREIAWLINTHGHADHTFGNQLFSEATIVAHENCLAEMQEGYPRMTGMAPQVEAILPRWRTQLAELEEGSEAAHALATQIAYYEQMIAGTDDFELTPPEVTFTDRMNLDLGDLTLELVYYGRAHSHSDIIVYCPEEALLLVGDLFYTGGMPGYIDSERIPELGRWREILTDLLAREEGIAHIVTGHEESLPVPDLEATLAFITEQEALYAGRESTLNRFRDLHEQDGLATALPALRRMHADSTRYYTLRPELDTYAYRLMLDSELEEALQIFLVMSELWPEAYISWDSLGEIYMRLDRKDEAIAAFEKSLELNPENGNAIRRLEELRGEF